MNQERMADAEARLSQGPPAIGGGAEVPAWGWEPVDKGLQPFPLAVLLFGTVLRAGWAWILALPPRVARTRCRDSAGTVLGGGKVLTLMHCSRHLLPHLPLWPSRVLADLRL